MKMLDTIDRKPAGKRSVSKSKNSCTKVKPLKKKEDDGRKEANKESFHKRHWDMVRFQNAYAPGKTMRLCNRVPLRLDDGIQDVVISKVGKNRAGYRNLMTCRNHWCPHCSDIYNQDRRVKAKSGLSNAFKAGFDVKMVTLTIPRIYGNDDYRKKFSAMNEVFRAAFNLVRMRCKKAGINLWTMKGLDVTIDSDRVDATHLHIHSLIISDDSIKDFENHLWRAYRRLMKKRGIIVSEKGFDVKDIFTNEEITDYIVKTLGSIERGLNSNKKDGGDGKTLDSMEREITSTKKDGRDGKSKGWWLWLDSIIDNPSDRDIQIYRDFLNAAKGRRSMDFSRNWDTLIEIDPDIAKNLNLEQSDEIKDQDEDIEDASDDEKEEFYWSASMDIYLWNAIKETKSEADILEIVDEYFDEGKNGSIFRYLENLIDMEKYDLIGKRRQEFYCQQIKMMLHWRLSMTNTKGEQLWQNLMMIE